MMPMARRWIPVKIVRPALSTQIPAGACPCAVLHPAKAAAPSTPDTTNKAPVMGMSRRGKVVKLHIKFMAVERHRQKLYLVRPAVRG